MGDVSSSQCNSDKRHIIKIELKCLIQTTRFRGHKMPTLANKTTVNILIFASKASMKIGFKDECSPENIRPNKYTMCCSQSFEIDGN